MKHLFFLFISTALAIGTLSAFAEKAVNSDSRASAPSTPTYDWKDVKEGCLENVGKKKAELYENIHGEKLDYQIEIGQVFPPSGANPEFLRCTQLQETKVDGKIWYRLRKPDAWNATTKKCAGEFVYIEGQDGLRHCKH